MKVIQGLSGNWTGGCRPCLVSSRSSVRIRSPAFWETIEGQGFPEVNRLPSDYRAFDAVTETVPTAPRNPSALPDGIRFGYHGFGAVGILSPATPVPMLPKSFQTRAVRFAFLMGPPQMLSRQDGSRIHNAICEQLGIDDLSFKYSSASGERSSESRRFSIEMERQQGQGKFAVTIDNPGIQAPVRMLLEYSWPPSRGHVHEDLDLAAEAAADNLGDGWQRVVAEARVRGQVQARGDSASEYLAKEILHLSDQERESLGGSLPFLSVGYETPAGKVEHGDHLANPKREATVEVLREDPSQLYVELMSQWPQLATSGVAPGTIEIDPAQIRNLSQKPSDYVKSNQTYLHQTLLPLFDRALNR